MDFNKPFSCERKINSFVRRRRWIRWRRFVAEERWLLIPPAHPDPLEDPFQDISVGGEVLPHRPDGFLAVWAVTVRGSLLYRQGVERRCPEGVSWREVTAPRSGDSRASSRAPSA